MPVLTEEALQAIRSVLIRDLNVFDPHLTMESRFDEIEAENPVMWEWMKNTAVSLQRAACQIPEDMTIAESVPVDDERAFVSLRLAQNMVLVTAIQMYKAIKSAIEVKEMEGPLG